MMNSRTVQSLNPGTYLPEAALGLVSRFDPRTDSLANDHLITRIAPASAASCCCFLSWWRRISHLERIGRAFWRQSRIAALSSQKFPSSARFRIYTRLTRLTRLARLFRQRLKTVLRHFRPIQSPPACVEGLDESPKCRECGGHDGVVCFDVQPDKR